MKPVMMNNMQGSSDTSSDEESDHQDESAKRSYECTFCRRGFTNAQALGGHMNIHRKDKAKANKRATPNNSSLSSQPYKYYTHEEEEEEPIMMTSPFTPQISTQTPNCYTIFQPSTAPCYPINQPASYAFQYEFLNPTRYHQSLGTNQDLLGPNLSLQIGPSHHVNTDQVRRGIQKDGDVVDLELRLGHDPCSNY